MSQKVAFKRSPLRSIGAPRNPQYRHALLLVPMQIEGHYRGSINAPGDKVPNTGGDYGQATVVMENANDEEMERVGTLLSKINLCKGWKVTSVSG